MKELALRSVDALKTARVRYGDARVVQIREQNIHVRDQRVQDVHERESLGLGVRALLGPAWGFASMPHPTRIGCDRVVNEAVGIARAGRRGMRGTSQPWAAEPAHVDVYQTPLVKDPFLISTQRKLDLLLAVNERMLKTRGVSTAAAWMGFRREEKIISNTEGALLHLKLTMSWAKAVATATGRGEKATRYLEATPRSAGYEHIENASLIEKASRTAEEAVEKLHARPCPFGELDLILDPDHLALTLHESVGHPTELDRVLGWEANFAGTSFATLDKLGKFRYGSPQVNLVADNTLAGGLSSTGYDDDMVLCQAWDLIREGILCGYTTTRETAHFIGDSRSKGSSRADGWNHTPITRIPNFYLEPGPNPLSPEELISDTKDGIYIQGQGSFSIDQRRENFQFGGDAFWRIKNGKRKGMLKNVTYQSVTPLFWGCCDAICDETDWQLHGVLNCGKGQPSQTGRMSHGSATSRFRGITVGAARV